MAFSPDTRLQENFTLQRDPALSDPVHVPWTGLGLAAVLLLGVLLVFLRRRRVRPVLSVPTVPEPVEDTLAVLEAIWRQTRPDNIAPSITALAAVLRRYLSRLLAVDCTTATTLELAAHFSRCAGEEREHQALSSLRNAFFETADQIRFAGLPATVMSVRGLYEIARDFVQKRQTTELQESPPEDGHKKHKERKISEARVKPSKQFNAEDAEYAETGS